VKTKKIIYYSIFFFIFLFQGGILYVLYFKPSIVFIIESFLLSSLVFSFSGGFIFLYIGAREEDRNVRLLGFLLIGVSISGFFITL